MVPAPGEGGEVWGHRQQIGKSAALTEGLRRVLALRFRAGGMVLFIPWRVGAEESGAAK
jgi:hypothetical protein